MPQEQVETRAKEVYEEFSEIDGDKALISLGSVKSNLTVEMIMGAAFGCDPFVSQDEFKTAKDRSCPFFLRYRDNDPHPPAASAGLKLSKPRKQKSQAFITNKPTDLGHSRAEHPKAKMRHLSSTSIASR